MGLKVLSATGIFVLLSLSKEVLGVGVSGCPGVFAVPSAGVTGCCVGATLPAPYISNCPGWPICTGSTTPPPPSLSTHPLSCATWIPASDPNWSSLVAEASASLEQSGTDFKTTLTNGNSGATTVASSNTAQASPTGDITSGTTADVTASSTSVSANGQATSTSSAAAGEGRVGMLNGVGDLEAAVIALAAIAGFV